MNVSANLELLFFVAHQPDGVKHQRFPSSTDVGYSFGDYVIVDSLAGSENVQCRPSGLVPWGEQLKENRRRARAPATILLVTSKWGLTMA